MKQIKNFLLVGLDVSSTSIEGSMFQFNLEFIYAFLREPAQDWSRLPSTAWAHLPNKS